MLIPETLRYSEDHEWVLVEDGIATIGITDHAQEELGDIVFVELPAVGAELAKSATFGVVESVKAVSDVYAPLGGIVTAVNEALTTKPETINEDPYGAGWMVKVTLANRADADALMTAEQYRGFLAQEKP
ncbi:MAG: glycine cleavage system protein GcvH [Deltaproteobacteria bacterium]|nr:glycine cleavage system protein GcvH [Deltaproteobacteria bacterium]